MTGTEYKYNAKNDKVPFGTEILRIKGNHYLDAVLAKLEDGTYASWTHNKDCGGYHGGHYDMTLQEGLKALANKADDHFTDWKQVHLAD